MNWTSSKLKLLCIKGNYQESEKREFPGGPVLRTSHFQCREHGFDNGLGTKISQAVQEG